MKTQCKEMTKDLQESFKIC